MKIAIITSLIGDRDDLVNPTIIHPNIDYYAFVDKKWNCTTWKQIPIVDFTIDTKYQGRRNAKIYKIIPQLFLPDYEYYIWADPTHDVVENPLKICQVYLSNNHIAVFHHTDRKCVYHEANILKELNYDYHHNIDNQIQFYRMEGFPENYGLYELSTFAIKNTPESKKLSLKMWELICRYSSRDQLSLPYVLWKLNIIPAIMPGYANGYNHLGQIGNNDLIPQKRSHKY